MKRFRVISIVFMLFSLAEISCAANNNSNNQDSPRSEVSFSSLTDEHFACMNGIYELLKGIQDTDSAEAAVPELSRLRKKNRELELEMRNIPRSEVPAYREYVKKVSPIIRNIFEEEDRIDRQGYYNSANLRALFIVAPTYSSSAKSAK